MEQNTNEIDLAELSVRLYHFFLRRYKLLGIFILIGIVYGIFTYFKIKDQFENKTIATSYIIPAPIIINIINSLNDIISQDKLLTGKLLNIGQDDANKLNYIQADTLGTFYSTDQEITTTIEIKIIGNKSLNFEQVFKNLISYIDSNQYVKNEVEGEMHKSNEIIRKCDEQIKNLDSLQKIVLKSAIGAKISNADNIFGINNFSGNYFSNNIVGLESNKQYELKKIGRIKSLYIIDEHNSIKIIKTSFYKILFIKVLILFGLGIFLCLILEFRGFVKSVEKDI
jgi:hypothetical protein